jgi:hypothetical protein
MDRDEMSNLYRGPSIDASYQVSVHLAEGFQRWRLKCEKLTDDRRQVMQQKLTLPLARWAKNVVIKLMIYIVYYNSKLHIVKQTINIIPN